MDFLKARLVEIGKTPAAFARALGLPKARAYEMQKGTRKLQPGEFGAAARFLDWSEAELVAHLEGRATARKRPQDHKVATAQRIPLHADDTPPRPLLLYRVAPVEKGRQDGFMLRAEKVGEVERPDFLIFSERAFAAKVLDDKNAPAYRRRDTVLVDPDSPHIEDEDCLFTNDPTVPAGSLSVIGCLLRSTATLWIIRQYGVKAERELTKSEFPNAWPIVGRYNRR